MTYAIKHNTKCQAWELGSGSEMEQSLISQGRICTHPNGVYEIFSLEAQDGKGQIAKVGDYFKVEYRGWPQPCNREWFLQNHKHPVTERSSIEMIPYSKEYQESYRQMYK